MKVLVALSAVLMMLSGCGGSDKPAKAETARDLTFLQVCHLIASELPDDNERGGSSWTSFAHKLADVKTDSALARQMIQDLTPASTKFAATPAAGEAFLEARAELRDALSRIGPTCTAAGSTDYQ